MKKFINLLIRFWRWLLKLLGLYEEETIKEKKIMDLHFKTNETYRGVKNNPASKTFIFDNQFDCAKRVVEWLASDEPRSNYAIIQGYPQSGKTGAMIAIANIILCDKLYVKSKLGIRRIIYITGSNSKGLKGQTEERFKNLLTYTVEELKEKGISVEFKKNSDLKNENIQFDRTKRTPDLSDSLIFIDESHFATNETKNVLPKWLTNNGINFMRNEPQLMDKNVYMVSVSATPYAETGADTMRVKGTFELVPANGYNYNWNFNLLGITERERTDPTAVLNNLKKCCEHLKEIEDKTGVCKCIIARINSGRNNRGKLMDIIAPELEQYFDISEFSLDEGGTDVNNLENKIMSYCGSEQFDRNPNKYLMIYIKGILRMGMSLRDSVKEHIGAIYDVTAPAITAGKTTIATTEQGLLGRICGYWNYTGDILAMIPEEHQDVLHWAKELYDENGEYIDKEELVFRLRNGEVPSRSAGRKSVGKKRTDLDVDCDQGIVHIDITDWLNEKIRNNVTCDVKSKNHKGSVRKTTLHFTENFFEEKCHNATSIYRLFAAEHHEALDGILGRTFDSDEWLTFDKSETPVDYYNAPINFIQTKWYDENLKQVIVNSDLKSGIKITEAYRGNNTIGARCFAVSLRVPKLENPTDEKRLIMDIRQGVIVKKKPKKTRDRIRIPVKDTDLSKDVA